MAVCMGAKRWRLLRRLAVAGGRARWSEIRSFSRADPADLAGLTAAGFVADLEGGLLALTARGRVVQDLGEVSLGEFDILRRHSAVQPKGAAP